ncbi:nucleoside-diphosphate kinase [Longirhabdus pacifica]|uniref:nucleoside-diphosphate kinase n=1 Tax=Longirhabdus pacifica TaxID=2305227 RepID=UPI0010092CFE|nr:nucleoside-diphosphate kinase [Longirhabdus pacifica]
MEQTFLMVKPDGVQRGLIGEVVKRFEQKGFQMTACKVLIPTVEQATFHYEEHKDKPFFQELVDFITSGPVFAMVWKGDDIIQLSRTLIGKTKVTEAQPGTIRGDFALHTSNNIIHGSDSPESAAREIGNFFKQEEIVAYDKTIMSWL